MSKFKKGDKISITNDNILNGMMELGPTVTGEVYLTDPYGKIIGFKCDQTGRMETVTDGEVVKGIISKGD